MADLVIVCRRPGMIRGGRRHPPVAVHTLTGFTPAQLAEIVAEPEITVVVGDVVTLETLTDLIVSPPNKTAKAKGAAA